MAWDHMVLCLFPNGSCDHGHDWNFCGLMGLRRRFDQNIFHRSSGCFSLNFLDLEFLNNLPATSTCVVVVVVVVVVVGQHFFEI